MVLWQHPAKGLHSHSGHATHSAQEATKGIAAEEGVHHVVHLAEREREAGLISPIEGSGLLF